MRFDPANGWTRHNEVGYHSPATWEASPMPDNPTIPVHDHGFERLRADVDAADGFWRETDNHVLAHIPGRERLVVGFDNLASVDDLPRKIFGEPMIRAQGWGALGVLAKRKDWFRDESLFAAMEDIAVEGLYRSYPATSLYGSSMGGYGALTFARLVPGATVFAFAPQTSLDRDVVPFEGRYRFARSFTDWSGAYADAADGIGRAGPVQIVYDSKIPEDAAHAARLTGLNVRLLPWPYLTHKVPPALRRMEILKPVSLAGLEGRLDAPTFARLLRARHGSVPWVTGLLEDAARRGHGRLAIRALDAHRRKGDNWKLRQLRRRIRTYLKDGAGL